MIANFVNKQLLILALLFGSISCFAGACTPVQLISDQKRILKSFATHALADRNSSGYITAIAMVSQRGNFPPISINEGTTTKNGKTYITTSSLFQIGSITKSFITVLILQLAKKYHFSIDDDTIIARYFPEYPKWGKITLRELMNMTSGIPGNGNNLPDDIFKKFTAKEYSNYISPSHILDLTYKLPLHFSPGSHFEYSNTNYTLLGQFVYRITHHTAAFEIKTRIIETLKLKHTFFIINTIRDIPNLNPKTIVHGYAFVSKNYHPYPFMHFGQDITYTSLSFANTAGAMISTPSDINQYLHALYTPGILLDQRQLDSITTLISKKTGLPFITPPIKNDLFGYGLGIVGYYWPQGDRVIYLYNGVTNGFNFVYFYDPKTKQYLTFGVNSLATVINFQNSLNLFATLTKVCSSIS